MPRSVKLEVRDGVAILSGVVEWDSQRQAAQRAVENLASVEGVLNQITLTPRVSASGTKSMIKAAILRNALLDAKNITVNVIDDKVILGGSVTSHAAKKQADLAAWSSPHVAEVDNQISIRSH
jgi:osmotically-inducible protein OsmY